MNAALVELIWRRADRRCEYCLIPHSVESLTHEIDHIIARKHRGRTESRNLCLSCWHCNLFKGSDISSIDPATGKLTALYHPRRQRWIRHFRWQGGYIVGLSARGRVTVSLLRINDPLRLEVREALIAEGVFPPR